MQDIVHIDTDWLRDTHTLKNPAELAVLFFGFLIILIVIHRNLISNTIPRDTSYRHTCSLTPKTWSTRYMQLDSLTPVLRLTFQKSDSKTNGSLM